uniref:Ig-like domain-containing protein n=1 Tax=Oreochromis aureus TaxID=47969 RepID=A0A668UAT4_OREAU
MRWYSLIFCLFPGEVLVIGSNLPIIAAPGDDVILPCHLEPMFDVQGLTVEWSKPDLKPDPSDRLSRVEYVHLYRDRKEVPDMKMASYFRRTELFMDDMKHGNISLKILNVSEEDNGRYRCFIPKLRSRVKAAVVELFSLEKKHSSASLSACLMNIYLVFTSLVKVHLNLSVTPQSVSDGQIKGFKSSLIITVLD